MSTTSPVARILSLALVALTACAAPAVCGGCGDGGGVPEGWPPAAFRVEAEIAVIDGLDHLLCTPREDFADGPDWLLTFEDVYDAEPTFTASGDSDSAGRCQQDGGIDCCRPLVTINGGWTMECDGADERDGRNRFEFLFHDRGSGVAVSTRTSDAGETVCVVHVVWPALLPL